MPHPDTFEAVRVASSCRPWARARHCLLHVSSSACSAHARQLLTPHVRARSPTATIDINRLTHDFFLHRASGSDRCKNGAANEYFIKNSLPSARKIDSAPFSSARTSSAAGVGAAAAAARSLTPSPPMRCEHSALIHKNANEAAPGARHVTLL